MERTAVKSREIAIVGYDPETATLEVAFRNGGVYHYEKVPSNVYSELLTSPSQGKFFEARIKNQFPYRKIR